MQQQQQNPYQMDVILESLRQLQTAQRKGWITTNDHNEAKKNIFHKYSGLEGLKLAAAAREVL